MQNLEREEITCRNLFHNRLVAGLCEMLKRRRHVVCWCYSRLYVCQPVVNAKLLKNIEPDLCKA